jgi:hypothetical protein
MGDESGTGAAFEIELVTAKRALALARFRMMQDGTAFGGRGVDLDLRRRHRDALARVRYLETQAA